MKRQNKGTMWFHYVRFPALDREQYDRLIEFLKPGSGPTAWVPGTVGRTKWPIFEVKKENMRDGRYSVELQVMVNKFVDRDSSGIAPVPADQLQALSDVLGLYPNNLPIRIMEAMGKVWNDAYPRGNVGSYSSDEVIDILQRLST